MDAMKVFVVWSDYDAARCEWFDSREEAALHVAEILAKHEAQENGGPC